MKESNALTAVVSGILFKVNDLNHSAMKAMKAQKILNVMAIY
jgi:hypothetical protein